ncbi:MAG: ImmA/IrrE family metallo-endopeptidase [Paraclostridium sp.]
MKKNDIIRCNKQSIELLALDVLESHDIISLPVDPVLIANNLGIRVYAENFETYNGDKVSGAIVKHEDGTIEILVNENDTYERQRFTIAHELGHYFLHLKNAPQYERVDMHRATGYSTNIPQEVEANNFAAALLMNETTVLKKFLVAKDFGLGVVGSIDYLSNQFGVSKQAMQYRLRNLGLI